MGISSDSASHTHTPGPRRRKPQKCRGKAPSASRSARSARARYTRARSSAGRCAPHRDRRRDCGRRPPLCPPARMRPGRSGSIAGAAVARAHRRGGRGESSVGVDHGRAMSAPPVEGARRRPVCARRCVDRSEACSMVVHSPLTAAPRRHRSDAFRHGRTCPPAIRSATMIPEVPTMNRNLRPLRSTSVMPTMVKKKVAEGEQDIAPVRASRQTVRSGAGCRC